MTRAVADEIDAMTESTLGLQRSIADLTNDQAREPSLLPDWTRGHVLTHLARNADGLRNLLRWAHTGIETPMYVSRQQRAADIEVGSTRPARELVDDVAASHERLLAAMGELAGDEWDNLIRWGAANSPAPVRLLPPMRRVEVEIHHVDLDLGYTLAHLPPDFVLRMLATRAKELSERTDLPGFVLIGNENEGRWAVGDGRQEITGPPPSLLGWVLGRTDGIGLYSAQALPELGPWR